LPGRSVTRLTAYHISRHVASTFKSLATTTTHFDLKVFIKTDRVNFQVMIQHMTLSVILIVVAEFVNKQLLYRASDRISLDFYRSYLAEHLSDKDSGTTHWFPMISCN
jgi:hypothetical protein